MKSKLFRERSYRFVIAMILCISLCVSPMNAFALDSISTEPMLPIPTAEEAAASVSAIAYSIAPDHLYPFIYDGTAPSSWREIDTTNCVANRLYVYNSNTDQVTPIGETAVTGFTTTQDHLFYVTPEQQIIQTDYTGSSHTPLYRAASGDVLRLDYFNGVLHFIEGGNRVVLLDVASRQAVTVLQQEGLCSLFFFDDDKFIWWNTSYKPFYYNISTREGRGFDSDHELSSFVASYTAPAVENGDVEMLNSLLTENDVTLPLPEYPARHATYTWPYPEALTYFINNADKTTPRCYHNPYDDQEDYGDCKSYADSNECDGFAKYAHLMYIHRYDSPNAWPYVVSGDTNTEHLEFDDEVIVREFFAGLTKGAFVRFGSKEANATACKEQHSAVFCGIATANAGEGVWLYECNQDWKCGVFYTFYTFNFLASHYHCKKAVVNHTFNGAKTVFSSTKYKLPCTTPNCGGYLLQSHTGTVYTTGVDGAQHQVWCTCCAGEIYEAHTFSYGECTVCGYS